ncbi:hypothetical protein [Candidatus Thiosymbion oneisti]|uniref:hypothetical protein n=1 Tax=Candidatus Thiosymbion oneisti TaxID=589554 RepID=UPI00114CA87E|nr:hypothetical protein [Candidatus Thiosymbion oneisti]
MNPPIAVRILLPLKRSVTVTFLAMLIVAAVRGSSEVAGLITGAITVGGVPAWMLLLPTRKITRIQSRFGSGYATIGLLHLASLILISIAILPGGEIATGVELFAILTWLLLLVLQFVLFLIAWPTAIIRRNESTEEADGGFDVSQPLLAINESFENFHQVVSRERKVLDVAISSVKEKLDQQQLQLKATTEALQHQKEEAEHYRKLADLSKEQQDLFLQMFRRQKRTDYVVGLILGFVASLVAGAVFLFVDKVLIG